MPTHRPLPLYRSGHPCSVQGCREPRVQKSASSYCQRHRTGYKNHGHPEQVRVRISEVARYEVEVRAAYRRLGRSRHAELPERAKLYCRDFHDWLRTCAEGASSYGSNRFAVESARRLLRVFDDVEPLAILTRATAMYLMQDEQRRMFRSDRAFRYQLVRTVRKLTSVSDGSYVDQKRNRLQQVVNEIPMRVTDDMAALLVDFVVPWVAQMQAIARTMATTEKARNAIASETFAPLLEKVRVEHSKAERRLAIAQRVRHDDLGG